MRGDHGRPGTEEAGAGGTEAGGGAAGHDRSPGRMRRRCTGRRRRRRHGEEEKKRREKIEIEKMRRLVKQGLTRVLHSTGGRRRPLPHRRHIIIRFLPRRQN
jgi:hypothetical protein